LAEHKKRGDMRDFLQFDRLPDRHFLVDLNHHVLGGTLRHSNAERYGTNPLGAVCGIQGKSNNAKGAEDGIGRLPELLSAPRLFLGAAQRRMPSAIRHSPLRQSVKFPPEHCQLCPQEC